MILLAISLMLKEFYLHMSEINFVTLASFASVVPHLLRFYMCLLLQGKIEMELELITGEEADERPAGLGQEEPNQHPKLDPPK